MPPVSSIFTPRRFVAPLLACLCVLPAIGSPAAVVQTKRKTTDSWTAYETTTLESLPKEAVEKTDEKLDGYGGLVDRKVQATGFFAATQIEGRWWLVDPDGGLFINKAVVDVSPVHSPGGHEAFKTKYSDNQAWSEQTATLLRENGFNGTGAWSDNAALRQQAHPLAYTNIFNFMGDYGKKRGGTYQQPGHLGYPKDCLFVFDPAFEKFCDEEAQKLEATKDDPWLLGTFSDNELPFRHECLANYLTFPADDPGHQAAEQWLHERHGAEATEKDITEQDKKDFLGVVVERYYRIVSQAIKRHDPHHLYLGSRINGRALEYPEVFKALGAYVDVIAVNYYWAWTPDEKEMAMWTENSGKPVLVTEWYAKGEDSGMANTGGAGWIVRTQKERGAFYQNFTLGLLRSKTCVGWQWFKYADNDPANLKADPSNRDANKGIVTARYEPYPDLIAAMKALNERVYSLEDYFARQGK